MFDRTVLLSLIILSVFPAWADPPAGQRVITFKENLSIAQENLMPDRIIIDPEGNICVYSEVERTLLVFGSSGRELSRRSITKGQGPGEFNSFDPVFLPDGRLIVADWPQRRITILGPDFNLVNIEKMKLYGNQFRLDSKGQRYFLAYQASKSRERNRVVLTKCTPNGDVIKEIADYDWGPRQRSDGTYETDLFRTQIKYALDSQDNVVYAFSNEYKIFIVSPTGELVRTIIRDVKPRKVEKEDLDQLLPDPAKSSGYKYLIPDRVPAIAGLFPLTRGCLLVVTFEKADLKGFLAGDLFDVNGRYIATVPVPQYYHWDFLLAPQKSSAVVWKENFYTIECDANEEKFWIKCYRIEWK